MHGSFAVLQVDTQGVVVPFLVNDHYEPDMVERRAWHTEKICLCSLDQRIFSAEKKKCAKLFGIFIYFCSEVEHCRERRGIWDRKVGRLSTVARATHN